jgi:2-iminobutanoate/2-iminopropanoate deaminase
MMTVQEIFANQQVDPVPVGVRVDDLVHGLRITGVDPATGKLLESLEAQSAQALANLQQAVEGAGGSLENVAQVSFFFKNFTGSIMRDVLNPIWVKLFTDENARPTYKFMPAPELPEGQLVHLEFWAVLGQKRTSIQIPKVAHTNPIPFGVRMGRYLFSSRCLPMDPETGSNAEGFEKQLACSIANASTLIEMAGLSWSDVTNGRAFLSDLNNLPVVSKAWQAKFGAGPAAPLQPVLYGAGGNTHVYVEFIAAAQAA